MLKRWLLAIIFRARMGATEAVLLVVTFGAALLATLPLQPKPGEAGLLHVLWAMVLVGASLLVVRGLLALVLAALAPLRAHTRGALDRLPVEIRSPIVRKRFPSLDALAAEAPLGFLDYEQATFRAMANVTRTLDLLSQDTAKIGRLMEKYTPRFLKARDFSTDDKVKLSKEMARALYPFARRMEAREAALRAGIEQMATNYLERFKTLGVSDLERLRPGIVQMRTITAESRESIAGYREALITNRAIGVQQALNAVVDRLVAAATETVSDFDRTTRFTNDALQVIDARLATEQPKSVTPTSRKKKPAVPRP
jgi:hypothetical protein